MQFQRLFDLQPEFWLISLAWVQAANNPLLKHKHRIKCVEPGVRAQINLCNISSPLSLCFLCIHCFHAIPRVQIERTCFLQTFHHPTLCIQLQHTIWASQWAPSSLDCFTAWCASRRSTDSSQWAPSSATQAEPPHKWSIGLARAGSPTCFTACFSSSHHPGTPIRLLRCHALWWCVDSTANLGSGCAMNKQGSCN